jgi:predicted O-methyltransferase YrrM
MDPLVDTMFRSIDVSRKPGSEISAHMPTLYALARLSSYAGVVECGVGGGFSTIALFCGVLEGGGRLTSYDKNEDCRVHAVGLMGLSTSDLRLDRWTFVARDSVQAAGEWKDGSVGLFFLDTSHRLEATRRELSAWLSKMHPEGIMCGHDYNLHLSPGWEDISGVKQAVDEFAAMHADRFRLQVIPYDHGLFILWPR